MRDEQGELVPEVAVGLSGPAVAGHRESTTDRDGLYRFTDLPPGQYTLTATHAGFATLARQNIVIRAGLNVAVDVTMEVGSVAVTVDVKADAPMLEVSTAVHGVNISGELQDRLPLSARRDWADFLLVTPGVVDGGGFYYWVHGSDLGSHVMQLDGVDLAAALQNATVYIRLNTDSLEDVQVKTAAIDAGAPLGEGAVISMVSKSGTNRFAGIEGFSIRDRRWTANNNPGGTSSGSSFFQPDLSLGGPLRRDRWWFFGSYRYLHESQAISRTPDQIATLTALAPGFEPFTNDVAANITFGKITGQLSSRHRMYGMYQYDRTPSDANGAINAQRLAKYFLGGSVYAVGLSSMWGPSFLTRLVGSFNDKTSEGLAVGSGPIQVVNRSVFASAGVLQGTGPIAFLGNQDSSGRTPFNKWTLSGDATYYRPGWGGAHELRAGFNLQYRHEEAIRVWSNNGFFQEHLVLRNPADPSAGAVPFLRVSSEPAAYTTLLGHSNDFAFYVQDNWRVTPRVTVGAGVRTDVIARADRLFGVETQRSTEVGPRLGVNYLLTSDNRSVIRASWGRVHDALSTNTIPVGDDTPAVHRSYDLNLDGVFETTFDTPRITTLADILVLDPTRSQPYVNEWTVGYSRQLRWQTTFDAAVIRREYRNRTAFIAVNGIYDGGVFGGYRNPNVDEIYEVTGNVWNWPVYSGLELQATRQSSDLQFIAG